MSGDLMRLASFITMLFKYARINSATSKADLFDFSPKTFYQHLKEFEWAVDKRIDQS
jgi:hypothetical protein